MRKDKEKRTKETNIGKIIYGFLLFMPLLAILSTCLYAIFNKNAYQSYNENTKLTLVNNSSQLESGSKYRVSTSYETSSVINNTSARIYFDNVSNLDTNYLNLIPNIDSLESFTFTYYTKNYLVFYDSNNTQVYGISLDQFYVKFDFDIVSSFMATENILSNTLYKIETLKLDNVFYYSIDKVEQSNLFNWAQNSVIYTGIYNTCQQLSITNTFIPLLMAYWLIISVIYILYDIILMMLILFHRKVHELQDSI